MTTARLISIFGERPLFWRLLAAYRWITLRIGGLGLRGVRLRRFAADESSAAWQLSRRALGAVCLAVIIFVGLWAVNRWRLTLLSSVDANHGWLAHEARRSVNGSSYDQMLQALAGVGGVFLALYFTAISAVAATVYVSVPHDVRNMLLADKESQIYVWVVALLTALSGLVLVARSGGAGVWLPALPVLAVLTLLAVYAFIGVSRRTFYLFDPTILSSSLVRDFRTWAERACRGSYRADDPRFQAVYGQRARRLVRTLNALSEIAVATSAANAGPTRAAANTATVILRGYVRIKSRIPSQSKWFGSRLRHKQWFLTSSFEVGTASATMTPLQPDLVPDRDWVERDLTSALTELTLSEVRARNFEQAAQILASIADSITVLAWAGQVTLALEWAEALIKASVDAALADTPVTANDQRETVALLDTASMLLGAISIGLLHQTHGFNVDGLENQLTSSDAIRDFAAGRPLPPAVKEHLESVADMLTFEEQSQAPLRTPGWYVAETTLNTLGLALADDLPLYIARANIVARATVDRASQAGRAVEAAAMASKGIELSWRIDNLIEEVEDLAAAITQASRLGPDLRRPEWDWSLVRGAANDLQLTMAEQLAAQIPRLALLQPREDVPDYLGEAVHRAGETCFDRLLVGDATRFARLFQPYFTGARTVAERVRFELRRQHPVSAMPWLTEPIVDLLALSGQGLIYAELREEPALWHPVRAAWDQALTMMNGQEFASIVAAIVSYREGRFGFGPRDMIRTWDETTDEVLAQIPAVQEGSDNIFGPGRRRDVQHSSPLIRELGQFADSGLLARTSGLDVFVVRYLMNRPEAAGLDFGLPDHRVAPLRALPPLESEA